MDSRCLVRGDLLFGGLLIVRLRGSLGNAVG